MLKDRGGNCPCSDVWSFEEEVCSERSFSHNDILSSSLFPMGPTLLPVQRAWTHVGGEAKAERRY